MKFYQKYIPAVMIILFFSQIYGQNAQTTYYLSITHDVADYDTWKTGFDNHISARQAADLKDIFVKRDINKANTITALFEVNDLNKAKAFISDPGLKEAMTKVGVVGAPQIHFYKSAAAAEKIKTGTLLTMITGHVKDFSAWKAEHKTTEGLRQEAGITDQLLLQSLSDENTVTILSSITSLSGFDNYVFTGPSYLTADQPESMIKKTRNSPENVSKPEINILF